MDQLRRRRAPPRANSDISLASKVPTQSEGHAAELQIPYSYPPTIPSPFTGTLEASLDELLKYGAVYPQLNSLMSPFREDRNSITNWPQLCKKLRTAEPTHGRVLLVEFVFIITRLLLPHQIVENRGFMYSLYSAKGNLTKRVMLRYDMLREWRKRDNGSYDTVESKAPSTPAGPPPSPFQNAINPHRPPLLPNIVSTLVAGPAEGYSTKKLNEAMNHHVTELDRFLLLSDEEVSGWDDATLVVMLGNVALTWQWLRDNNAVLDDMRVNHWDDLDGRADENRWVRDTKSDGKGSVKDEERQAGLRRGSERG